MQIIIITELTWRNILQSLSRTRFIIVPTVTLIVWLLLWQIKDIISQRVNTRFYAVRIRHTTEVQWHCPTKVLVIHMNSVTVCVFPRWEEGALRGTYIVTWTVCPVRKAIQTI
jgi:hypothetical protein